jgi:medium-chain acyl-[acyl-carrier-protein] hydrolase
VENELSSSDVGWHVNRAAPAPDAPATIEAKRGSPCIALSRRVSPAITLLCFPYAGGSPTIFKAWTTELPDDVAMYGVQLPGRGARIAEAPATQIAEVASELSRALLTLMDTPFVFFGHSLGALVAFETAKWLWRNHGMLPDRLVVSGRRAPHLPNPLPSVFGKSDDELIARLHELNGTPPEVLGNVEMLHLLLPVLRADFGLAETYTCEDATPLRCPITVVGGREDPETSDIELEAWRAYTTVEFTKYMVDGDHFFVHASGELTTILRRELSLALAARRGRSSKTT